MNYRADQSSGEMSETLKALKSVRVASLKKDLQNQLRHVENAFKRNETARASAYMQALATTVLMLRGTLKAATDRLLTGIIKDSYRHRIALPIIKTNEKSRCSRGECIKARFSKCLTIPDATGGCANGSRNLVVFPG
jgi:hypothetical protein